MEAVKLLFFAQLKEAAGMAEMEINFPLPASLKQLLIQLEKSTPSLHLIVQNKAIRIAINGTIAEEEMLIQNGDEIAFLPPFSGG